MVKKTGTRKLNLREARRAVEKLCVQLEREQIPYKKVFLFGSHARGKQHQYSDIDAAVVLPAKLQKKTKAKIRHLMVDKKNLNWRLEIHFFSEKDFENKYLSLPPEIKKHGIRIA